MLKKLKKLYFKIYHLFKLIGIFVIVFGLKENVYAITLEDYQSEFAFATPSCTENLFYPVLKNTSRITTNSNSYVQVSNGKATYFMEAKPSTTYTISNINKSFSAVEIFSLNTTTSNPKFIKSINTNITQNFTTLNDTNYIGIYFSSYSFGDLTNIMPLLNEGSEAIEFIEYKTTCTPPTPPGPQPNEAYTNFIALYTNRLQYLAEGFTNNSYLIAMIGIIIAWVVLELALKLFNLKGGYKK